MKRTLEALTDNPSPAVAPEQVFQAVCKDVVEETGANRVSIWHFYNGESCIECDCLYAADNQKFSNGQILIAKDLPTYFDTVLTEKFINASDARNHPATVELADHYFNEHNIYSILDFVIHQNFKPVGVICCENAGERREWCSQDVSYLRQISTLISYYFHLPH